MANPFYDPNYSQYQQMPQQNNGPFGNFQNLMNQFQQFRNSFRGDPKAQVQELLRSGKMTQQQFNQLSQLAQQFQTFLK